MSAIRMSPFHILAAINAYPRHIPDNTFFQIDEVLIDDVKISDATQPLPRMVLLISCMVPRIVSHWESSHLPRGRGRFADSHGIPLNQPTIFHPIPSMTIQLKHLHLLFVLLSQKCHLSRIDEERTFCDSTRILHTICQTPMGCQCK